MTREQAEALGRRALKAGWNWKVGAQAFPNARALDHGHGSDSRLVECIFGDKIGLRGIGYWGEVPDFRDPATRGILLQQVREVWADSHMAQEWDAEPDGTGCWSFYRPSDGSWIASAPSEAEALVSALESKP